MRFLIVATLVVGVCGPGDVSANDADDTVVEGIDRVTIPALDLDQEHHRQVVVDREDGQYLGHVTTVLLEDGKTIYAVYPKGHGRGAIVMKRSDDGGLTWSDRLPTPASWATSKEVPTLHRVIDANGRLFISFRCISPTAKRAGRPFEGYWAGWVGTYDDIVHGREGQYVVRLKDNKSGYDTTYPGVEVLPDGTFVATTYGHWVASAAPYILSVRFQLSELDAKSRP